MNDSWYESGAKKAVTALLFQTKEHLTDEEMVSIFNCIKALILWLWITNIHKQSSDLDKQVLKPLYDNFAMAYDEEKAKRILQMAVITAQGMFEQIILFNKDDTDGQDWITASQRMLECSIYRKTLCAMIKQLRSIV